MVKTAMAVIYAFGSGIVISGAVYAFIAMIGVVPRLAHKTKSARYIRLYEEFIIMGGIAGTLAMFVNYRISIGNMGAAIMGLAEGIFFGVLAICLTEVLNVIPILIKRCGLKAGL